MNTSAVVMMLSGFLLLWGGFGVCVGLAVRKNKN